MSLIVQETDLIPITVYYTIGTNKYGVKFVKVLEDKKAKEMLADEQESKKVKALNTKWKPQTWHAQNELFANSTVYNPQTGNRDVDWTRFRHAQLVNCLYDWDLKDDSGREFPPSEDNINQLHSSVANALSNRYADATSMEEGESGN